MPVVRRSEQRDVDQLIPLMLEYIVDFYFHPRPDDGDLRNLIETMLKGKEGFQLVAEEDGSLIGFASIYLSWETLTPGRISKMNDLYVVDRHRGKGVARQLFEACVEESRALGCRKMVWETAPDNLRAQRFYEKMGGRQEPWLPFAIDL